MKKVFLIFFFLFNFLYCVGQTAKYGIESQMIFNSRKAPFWFRSNQFGSIPISGTSLAIVPSLRKPYRDGDSSKYAYQRRNIDWTAGIGARMNLGRTTSLDIIEAYVKLKLGRFELSAGRTKSVVGIIDTTLSSGSFALSGNALGVPKIDISIPEYTTLPIFDSLVSIKGNFLHGWLGVVPITFRNVGSARNYLHQKSLYARLGKGGAGLALYGGFNQQVIWGDEKKVFRSENYDLTTMETLLHVLTGKNYYKGGKTSISHVGNQLGSIDVGVEYEFRNFVVKIYRQNLYEKGALYFLANLRDGLNGLNFVNKVSGTPEFSWKRLTLEVLSTKNQGGEAWSPWTASGPEQYYNHAVYGNGFSYLGQSLGTPFITPRVLAKEGQIYEPDDFFINNRVLLVHLGLNLAVGKWDQTIKLSYSKNYGTFWTSDIKYFWFNGSRVPLNPKNGVFKPVAQFSAFFEAQKQIKPGLTFGYMVAIDKGRLLNDSFGLAIKVRREIN